MAWRGGPLCTRVGRGKPRRCVAIQWARAESVTVWTGRLVTRMRRRFVEASGCFAPNMPGLFLGHHSSHNQRLFITASGMKLAATCSTFVFLLQLSRPQERLRGLRRAQHPPRRPRPRGARRPPRLRLLSRHVARAHPDVPRATRVVPRPRPSADPRPLVIPLPFRRRPPRASMFGAQVAPRAFAAPAGRAGAPRRPSGARAARVIRAPASAAPFSDRERRRRVRRRGHARHGAGPARGGARDASDGGLEHLDVEGPRVQLHQRGRHERRAHRRARARLRRALLPLALHHPPARRGFRVYALCMLGYGWSPKVEAPYSMEFWGEQVIAFAKEGRVRPRATRR